MRRIGWLDFGVYLIVRILVCSLQALPLQICHRGAQSLAWLLCEVLKVRREVIDDNLRLAFPKLTEVERHQFARRMWEHLFLLLVEVAQAPRKVHDTNWRDFVTLTGAEFLVPALLDPRPTVLVAGHYGNFELSGFMLGVLGFPSFTIARPLDNPYLDRFLNEFRGAKGQHILPKSGSAQQIDALLASGGTLVFLADQHAGPKGCWVDFFGRQASTHKAIALFSLSNDAPLLVCYSVRVGAPLKYVIGAEAIVDPRTAGAELASVPSLTQWYTRHLEQIIRRVPQQYWWLHRRWKDTRSKRSQQAA